MKLTPEQKAFYEFGKALGELKRFRMDHWAWCCVRFLDRRHAWRSGDGFACESQGLVDQHTQLIRDAWQKRAACRAWKNEYLCKECAHLSTPTCTDCKWNSYSRRRMIKSLWEPRKEGE